MPLASTHRNKHSAASDHQDDDNHNKRYIPRRKVVNLSDAHNVTNLWSAVVDKVNKTNQQLQTTKKRAGDVRANAINTIMEGVADLVEGEFEILRDISVTWMALYTKSGKHEDSTHSTTSQQTIHSTHTTAASAHQHTTDMNMSASGTEKGHDGNQQGRIYITPDD